MSIKVMQWRQSYHVYRQSDGHTYGGYQSSEKANEVARQVHRDHGHVCYVQPK